MTTATSIPGVIDALLGVFRALPACAAPVVVNDGVTGELEDTYVQVGATVEPTVEADQEWGNIGGPPRITYETYEVDGVISAYVGGDANAGVSGANDAQKSARDAAFAIYAAFNAQMKADPQMTAQNGGLPVPGVMWALPHRVGLQQTEPDSRESEVGRRADVGFKVHVYARLQ